MIDLKNSGSFGKIRLLAKKASGVSCISGVSESRSAMVSGVIAESVKGQVLVIAPSYQRAERLASDLFLFTKKKIYILPDDIGPRIAFDAKSQDALIDRLTVLSALCQGEDCIVVASAESSVKRLAPKALFQKASFSLEVGNSIDLGNLNLKLSNMGYERSPSVESKGQYVIRGGILDIFPPNLSYPVRVELFDIEVDSLRLYDPLSQRSLKEIQSILIYPAQLLVQTDSIFDQAIARLKASYLTYSKKMPKEKRERLLTYQNHIVESLETGTNLQLLENYLHFIYEEANYIWDYLADESVIVVDDPDRISNLLKIYEKDKIDNFKSLLEKGEIVPDDYVAFQGAEDFQEIYKKTGTFLLMPFQKQLKNIDKLRAMISVISRQGTVFNGRMDFLESELNRYLKINYQVYLICSSTERADNIREFVGRLERGENVKVLEGTLSAGMEFPDEKLVIISDRDIFLSAKRRKITKDGRSRGIKAFTEIKEGDYVVHENHGIGKFLGISQLEVQGVKNDYLKIKYAGEDILYVTVEQMDVIQRYVGSDSIVPKINKLSGSEWKRTKLRAQKAIHDMAKELLSLSAARSMEKGYAFSQDNLWQREFESLFPYEETPDQLRSVEEIKKDMEKPIPMDRLLCGDVGYGKTEVALRAVFKAVTDGKQSAILVPTTLLANQHYYTFKERFDSFPFKIEMLSRFRTDSQQKEIVDKVKQGKVDVLIGTHRLLSKDVGFNDLGLLVIDEEQRFGVRHKEIIKQLRKNVDVLTLSATPIPRTLHMSLVGIRDMSLIEEPPEERYPVQTYVMEEDDGVLKETIERELDRGGQVYVVFNRIRGIQKIASRIGNLVPNASLAVTHGRMGEKLLEDIMLKFVNNEYNVLISTTIIESGLDIPNANTIIILDADRFGLSQLYQLRGRVGRTNRIAYAYLMYQRDKVLSEIAEKRLRAIREFTEFGSGFHIAMRDLEIRGAGNLLGTEQHGHMLMIGYELYCKLVEDAVKELSGQVLERDVKRDVAIELPVEAYIPNDYIPDEFVKLHMYKKIASIRNADDRSELIDELLDRFGEIPKQAINLIEIAFIKSIAARNGIIGIKEELGKLVFSYDKSDDLNPEQIAEVAREYGKNLFVHGGKQPFIRLNTREKDKLKEAINFLTKIVQ